MRCLGCRQTVLGRPRCRFVPSSFFVFPHRACTQKGIAGDRACEMARQTDLSSSPSWRSRPARSRSPSPLVSTTSSSSIRVKGFVLLFLTCLFLALGETLVGGGARRDPARATRATNTHAETRTVPVIDMHSQNQDWPALTASGPGTVTSGLAKRDDVPADEPLGGGSEAKSTEVAVTRTPERESRPEESTPALRRGKDEEEEQQELVARIVDDIPVLEDAALAAPIPTPAPAPIARPVRFPVRPHAFPTVPVTPPSSPAWIPSLLSSVAGLSLPPLPPPAVPTPPSGTASVSVLDPIHDPTPAATRFPAHDSTAASTWVAWSSPVSSSTTASWPFGRPVSEKETKVRGTETDWGTPTASAHAVRSLGALGGPGGPGGPGGVSGGVWGRGYYWSSSPYSTSTGFLCTPVLSAHGGHAAATPTRLPVTVAVPQSIDTPSWPQSGAGAVRSVHEAGAGAGAAGDMLLHQAREECHRLAHLLGASEIHHVGRARDLLVQIRQTSHRLAVIAEAVEHGYLL
jgi:hypothetical protein